MSQKSIKREYQIKLYLLVALINQIAISLILLFTWTYFPGLFFPDTFSTLFVGFIISIVMIFIIILSRKKKKTQEEKENTVTMKKEESLIGIRKEKEEDLKKEIQMNQEIIAKWDRSSLSIKNWAITIWSLILVFIFSQFYEEGNFHTVNLFWIPFFVLIIFWLFDALFKYFQTGTIMRTTAIKDYLNEDFIFEEGQEDKIEFYKKFPIFDPIGTTSMKCIYYIDNYYTYAYFRQCAIRRMVTFLYLVLGAITFFVLSFMSSNPLWFIFSCLCISFLFASWIYSISGMKAIIKETKKRSGN